MSVAVPAELSSADHQVLTELIIEHAWLLDHGRWHDVAQLYVPNGSLRLGPNSVQGHDGLREWADRRAANTARHTHHQCTNIRLRAEAPGTASGTVMLVLHVVEGDGGAKIEFVGEYRDLYTRTGEGQWHFQSRALFPLGHTDTQNGSTDA
ncbi:nuclear transport factor 2 family protein [Mycolicibacterium sp. CBM1]